MTVFVHFCTYFLYFLVCQTYNCSHSRRSHFTCLLHSHGTCINKFQSVFKAQSTCRNKCGELSERVSCRHFRFKIISHAQCADYTMQKNCGLCNLCLLQLIIGSGKHNIGNPVTKNIVSFLKKFFCQRVIVVEVFAHTYKLCSLSGKNKCFHNSFKKFTINELGCKDSLFPQYRQEKSRFWICNHII